MRASWLPIAFLLMPLAEIAGFVIVGKAIGVWSTLGLVILTGVAGVFLLRTQGLQILRQLSQEGRQGRDPGEAMVHGAMIVVAALLLLIPGFITDIVGLMLFIPAVRRWLWSAIGRRVIVTSTTYGHSRSRGPDAGFDPNTRKDRVLDLDDAEFQRDPKPSSPWSDRRGRHE